MGGGGNSQTSTTRWGPWALSLFVFVLGTLHHAFGLGLLALGLWLFALGIWV